MGEVEKFYEQLSTLEKENQLNLQNLQKVWQQRHAFNSSSITQHQMYMLKESKLLAKIQALQKEVEGLTNELNIMVCHHIIWFVTSVDHVAENYEKQ